MSRDSGPGRPAALLGRSRECAALDDLVEAVRAGKSGRLVVHGEPGAGKTVLLDYLAGQAASTGCQVARVTGMQSEMELVFAGVHQLCAPMLARAKRLPALRRDALRTAFGLAAGPPPDWHLVGLAIADLLAETAGHRPLICLVDDEQWLDRASAQALGFAARRLAAGPVGLVFAARVPAAELAGMPELRVEGLDESDARALLDSALTGPLDERVRDLVIAETRGNPLALLELPRGLDPAELAGGFGLPGAVPLAGRIEGSFARQLAALPADTRLLLQLAAADPSGDRELVRRAAARLGIHVQAAATAQASLVTFGPQVRFRHPLVRSAAYQSAPFPERQRLHAALAEATDPVADPDRRAWHRAHAAPGPDEEAAMELVRSAGRAQARGGLAAAAAFLERSVLLTADPARYPERALAAAQAHKQAGAFSRALSLLVAAEARPLDELASARVELLRGQIAFSLNSSDAAALLLKAARRLEPLDLDLSRDTYVSAWTAARFAGHLAPAGEILEISRTVRALPPPRQPPRPLDQLLDGFALLVTDGPAAAAPALRRAASAFASADTAGEEVIQFGWVAAAAANTLWDQETFRAILVRQVELARAAGALERLPVALARLAMADTWRGDLTGADALMAEASAICEMTQGSPVAPYSASFKAALRGNEAEVTRLTEAAVARAEAKGQGVVATYAHWASAILNNGLGRYADALTAAERATRDVHWSISEWALPELIEAAVRSGSTALAADALARLAETTRAGGTEYGLGLEARSRALLSSGDAAEARYREAIGRLGRTRLRPDLARAHLVYGEWLRRQGRRRDARAQLRIAYGLLAAIGMEAFAERARAELAAAGEKLPEHSAEAPGRLRKILSRLGAGMHG